MAVIGRAEIIVRAITTGVKDDIRRGFQGTAGEAETAAKEVSKSFSKGLRSNNDIGRSFRNWSNEAENLTKNFHQAIRNSYKWQAASGALLQSIMALGGGILALSGSLISAASSGVAFIGLMAQMKITSLVAKQAFHGILQAVKASSSGSKKSIKELREEMQQLAFDAEAAALSEKEAAIGLEKAREELARAQNLPPDNLARREAELAYQKAELAYRRAKDKNKDLQEQINNPKKKTGSGTDPYKDLTKTQKAFALYLKSVMPQMKGLREAAASSFLPELQKQMERMFKGGYFDMLIKGFRDVSKGLADAVSNFAGTIFDPKNKNNMADFFKSTALNTKSFGSIIGNVFSGFLSLMKAIDPLVHRFALFLENKTSNFAKNMNNNRVAISTFFKYAGDAAAGWGKIFGRVGQRFKDFLKANIGPGTGGQLLLDWLQEGRTGFRGLDGAAADFARKNHFLAAAENLKAMLQSVGSIFGFLSDIGTSPEVKVFWETLANLRTPLEQIFTSITGSADAFAKLAVSVVEVIASFADSGQLRAYMDILSGIATFAGNTLAALRPLFQAFGPLIGAVGALITVFLVLGKVVKLLVGPFLLLYKGVMAVTKATLLLRSATMAGNIVAATSLVLKKSNLKLSALEKAALIKDIVVKRISNKLTEEEAYAYGVSTAGKVVAGKVATDTAVKNLILAGTEEVVGDQALRSIPKIAAFGATLWASLVPVLPAVLAIAAAIALVAGTVAVMNSIKTENSKKAVNALGKEFTSLKGQTLGYIEAQKTWDDALLAIPDGAKSAIGDVRVLGVVLEGSGYAALNASDALQAYETGLARLAKKSLPESQRQMRNLIVVGGLSRKEVTNSILANEDYTKALEASANAMGDTIKNADGTYNAIKLVDYAIGEGSYLRQKAVLENQALAQAYKDAANSFIDTSSAMQNATNGSKFSLSKYLDELKGQVKKLTDWRSNLSKIRTLFRSQSLYNDIVKMGSAGADLVASLAAGGEAAVNSYEAAIGKANAATDAAAAYGKAINSNDAILQAVSGNSTLTKQANALIGQGLSAGEIQLKLGISDASLIAAQKVLDTKLPDLASTVNITAAWDTNTLTNLRNGLVTGLSSDTYKITLTNAKATVGTTNNPYLSQGSGWSGTTSSFGARAGTANLYGGGRKNGGLLGFANGGKIPGLVDGSGQMFPNGLLMGPGGPRTDSLLVRASRGEFVVNAAATRRNLDLLHAINDNKTITGGTQTTNNNISINVNAAPGMNEQDVANLVSAKLKYELQTGFTS